jgi:rod shape determining protein RodA
MRGTKSLTDNIDWVLVLLFVVLVILGWTNIYATVYNEDHKSIFDFSQRYGKQLIWILAAFLIGFIVLVTDRQFFLSFSFPIYIAMMLLLIGVLFFGREIAGSKSWFAIGSIRLQPAEFAKFATCMAIAKYLSLLNIKIRDLRTKVISILIISLPMLLILLQGDAGSALVYLSFIFLLYREGLSGNFLLAGLYGIILFIVTLVLQDTFINLPFGGVLTGKMVLLFILFIIGLFVIFPFWRNRSTRRGGKVFKDVILIASTLMILSSAFIFSVDHVFENVLSEHQRNRINVLLAIKSDPRGTGYNVNQSKIAIGSGGMLGKGYLHGTQTKYDFVPEQSTDFIFCTVGEEWGFVGSVVVIGLFLVLLIRVILIAERQRSSFSRIYGYGVASILFFHFAVNIGMTIGLAPVIGIPLPFFSYGGSSLWGFTILLFVLIKLDAYRLESFR